MIAETKRWTCSFDWFSVWWCWENFSSFTLPFLFVFLFCSCPSFPSQHFNVSFLLSPSSIFPSVVLPSCHRFTPLPRFSPSFPHFLLPDDFAGPQPGPFLVSVMGASLQSLPLPLPPPPLPSHPTIQHSVSLNGKTRLWLRKGFRMSTQPIHIYILCL